VDDEQKAAASPAYAWSQLERALRRAGATGDERARVKAAQWQAVLHGMSDGTLRIGSRTPIADTPVWVTPEVVHGGFATGRLLAEAPLREDEAAQVTTLPADVPGRTDRERLNLWHLGDAGHAELMSALACGTYHVELPEDAALPVVALLLDGGHDAAALDLVAELWPHMHRLRMTPRPEAVPRPPDSLVRLETVGTVARALRGVQVPGQIAAMRETLRVWHPLFDRLVALWCETVDGELPALEDGSAGRDGIVTGGWPCQVWPADWSARRAQWLADYRAASEQHHLVSAHRRPRSNFFRLREALARCEADSRDLTGRDVGRIRRALAATITAHGAPGTERRAGLRALQAADAARPTHAALARVLAGRLDRYPHDGGIPALDPLVADVAADEAAEAPAGNPMPAQLVAKVARALEGTVEELVGRGLITSGEVLAKVVPQMTAGLAAASFADPRIGELYAQCYAAFRRRRSLLLLDLEHQVRFEELPWIAALEPLRTRRADTAVPALEALRRTTLLALHSFPQAILPNPLVRELGALANRAQVPIPLVEEVAADIFTGHFTAKWASAARIAAELLHGSLYARYYDLPPARTWTAPSWPAALARRWGKRTAPEFAELCAERAREAHNREHASFVAANGAVLEQSQILTTHNLAVLVDALDLGDRLRALAPDLAERAFAWTVRRLATPTPYHHAELQRVKNAAYAWRQALFFLSLCPEAEQRCAVARMAGEVAAAGLAGRFGPAVDGLGHVLDGVRFSAEGPGRRFLGWSVGPHWFLGD
jgi:hypothetical protein